MKIFYWLMGALIVGTFAPALLFLVLYVFTGDDAYMRRSSGLWSATRVVTLFGVNLLVWGHVIVGLWRIWFR